ncbi:MAG: hypothetical protein IAG13_33300 [Deltaproteobacteria bacterium]|nr:hypothetical protein [Nannocystaceae bacterium]
MARSALLSCMFAFGFAAGCEKSAAPTTTVPGECTDDAKICPDGTPVGRVGPSCEFAECPGAQDGAAPAVDGTAPDGQTSPPVPTESNDSGG